MANDDRPPWEWGPHHDAFGRTPVRYVDAAAQAAGQGLPPGQAAQAAAVARCTVPPSTAIAALHAAVGATLDDLDPEAVLAERAEERAHLAPSNSADHDRNCRCCSGLPE